MAECPAEALASKLPSGAKVVLAALWLRAGSGRRFVWPSRDTLAADVGGMSDRQLRRNLALLEAERWLVAEKDQYGHPGWSLCDPPGNVVHRHESAPNATHDRPVVDVQTAAEYDRTQTSNRTSTTAEPDIHDRRIPMEPTMNQLDGGNSPPLSAAVQERSDSAPALPSPPKGIGATAWRSDFVFAWGTGLEGQEFHVHDPTRGAHKLLELQAMLDTHGPKTVTAVLLHAQGEVLRHHETDRRFGLHPKMLGATFLADKPRAFEALLDAWQGDTGRKRVSGKLEVSPAKLDDVPLNDDDQRAWMMAQGDNPEAAVRDARTARDAAEGSAAMFERLAGSFDGVAP